MFAVGIVYLGLITTFFAAISMIKPLSFLGIHSRKNAALLLGAAAIVVVVGCFLPAKEKRAEPPRTQLDEFAPVYQFNEFHSIRVAANPQQVYRAIKSVTAEEIFLFRTLVWIRRFGRPGPESILNPAKDQPLLDVAARTGFIMLADIPNQEIVLGAPVVVPPGWRPKAKSRYTPEDFKSLHAPGFALATMNFHIEAMGADTCTLTTETRIYATDTSARRRFVAYWRVIYPGSALIRRMWLRAIARRAVRQNPVTDLH